MGQFDRTSGNLVLGTAIRLDQNLAGDTGPIPLGGFGGFTFGPDGKLWAAVAGQAGETILGQFDLSTGNLLLGGAIRLDQNTSGDTGPVPLSGFGGFTFDPDGNLWAALEGQAGDTLLGQFDLATGNLVLGTARRLDYNITGDGAPVPFEEFAGFAFAPELAAPGGVPEPATWAMMILGFGATGAMVRRRRAALA
ncbi:MAG: hypothetical protein DI570_17805 [Phenylobacterium zucineum]|nr:MAG: hypothetical protein DI570_17805 [Phenylobacterium zucineum]